MYSLLIVLQVFLMNWYIAKVVFGINSENQSKKQFDEQLRLIAARNQEEALLKARVLGLNEEETFLNDHKSVVKWEFINVAELIPLQELEDGMEVYSRIHEIDESKPYIQFIHQKAVALHRRTQTLN